MYNSKLSRDEFLNSHFLTIKLIDLQKSLLHRNKFVFQLVTDRATEYIKKNYGELKRFVSEITSKVGMYEFDIQHHLRSSEQYKSIEGLFKKINSGYLMIKQESNQTQISKKTLLRNYLYNLFYSNIQQASDEQETQKTQKTQSKEYKKKEHTGSFVKNKQTKSRRASEQTKISQIEQQKDQRKYREKTDAGYLNRLKNLYRVKAGQGEQSRSKDISQVWIKEGEEWVLRTFSISEHSLILSSIYSSNKQVIGFKNLEIALVDVDYSRIQMSHCLLQKTIQIRLRNFADQLKDLEELQIYVKLLSILKQAISSSNINQEKVCNFVGIKLQNKKNKFSQQVEKKAAKEMIVKLSHEGEVTIFPMAIDSYVMIHLPIFNNYGQIQCEMVQERQGGLISNFRYHSINFTLPVQNVYDQLFNSKPKRKNPEMKHFILQSKMCNYAIKLDYIQLGNFKSYCTYKPTDRFQGQKMVDQFTRSQFRIQKNRFKRIIYSTEIYMNYLKSLKNMENPVQSYIFYLLLIAIVVFYDANFMIHYFLAALAGIIMYCHPTSHSYFRELISILKLENIYNKYQKRSRNRNAPRFRVQFKKDIEKRLFLQKFKFTSKKQRNIVQKYQRLHQVLLKGQIFLTEIVTVSEKLKNIFTWYHHQKTKKVLINILIGLLVIVFIPIKFILLAVIYKTFKRGLSYRVRTRQMNRIILFEIFTLIAQQNNFNQAKVWLVDPSKPLDRKSHQYINFQKKIREWLNTNLQIEYDSQLFWESRKMNQVINYLSDSKKRFIIPEQVCRRYKFNLEWSASVSSLGRILIQIYGFIMNTPSDRNVLGIKNEQSERNLQQDLEENDSEQFEVQ